MQDAAARLVSLAAAPDQHARVLDVCAAPGGKSFALAMDMADGGDILSCDVHPHKLKLIESGAQRLGLRSIRTALADGRDVPTPPGWVRPTWWWRTCPAPALASSAKSRTSAIKTPRAIPAPAHPKAILDNVCRYVRPGGVLVYATCTILPEENEDQIAAFLASPPPNLKKRPSRCRASAAVTALSPSIPTVPARTASSSAVCAAARQHYDRHQIHDGSGADRLL